MRLTALYIYPVKSLGGIRVPRARLQARGLEHDRRWMVVDAEGRFLTQRELPRMAQVRVRLAGDRMLLEAPGQEPLPVPLAAGEGRPVEVQVWRDRVRALHPGHPADRWLSGFLGRDCRLVYMPEETRRAVDRDYAPEPGAVVSFADAMPLLLIGEGSLAELNRRLAEKGQPPVPMERFRPNLVVDAAEPHAEDGWRRIRIGDAVLHLVKPCSRCVVPSIDPATAEKGREPLRTLAAYRRGPDGKIYFGQNAVPAAESAGAVLEEGAGVTVLEGGPPPPPGERPGAVVGA